MHISQKPASLLSLLAILLSTSQTVHAKPYPKELLRSLTPRNTNGTLELRQQCANPCGESDQYCCSDQEVCATTSKIAFCTAGGSLAQPTQAVGVGGGNYQLFTTTYIETDLKTVTSTWSVRQTPGPGTPTVAGGVVTATANPCSSGQDYCGGWLCCNSDQTCAAQGQCVAKTNTAAIRPTSNTVVTETSTAAATTTEAVQTPVSSDGSNMAAEPSNKGLSGGAIAGIVIGVLLGLFLLFLLLACLCCKGIFDGIAAIFGRKKRRTEETYIETHHSHHSGSRPAQGRRWFGMAGGPSRPSQPKKSGGLGFLGTAGILGGLALALGLKRKHDRRDDEKSSYGSETTYSTDYYSDYTTSESSASSDRRTRTTRHSRR